MSTFRLEPEHYLSQLARSTFCQRPNRDPPERREFSPHKSLVTDENPCVLETFQPYRAVPRTVNPLESQDFHLIFTEGTAPPSSGMPFGIRGRGRPRHMDTLLPLAKARQSARAEAEDGQIIKDRIGGSAFRETLQGLCPRMRTPGIGINLEAC